MRFVSTVYSIPEEVPTNTDFSGIVTRNTFEMYFLQWCVYTRTQVAIGKQTTWWKWSTPHKPWPFRNALFRNSMSVGETHPGQPVHSNYARTRCDQSAKITTIARIHRLLLSYLTSFAYKWIRTTYEHIRVSGANAIIVKNEKCSPPRSFWTNWTSCFLRHQSRPRHRTPKIWTIPRTQSNTNCSKRCASVLLIATR